MVTSSSLPRISIARATPACRPRRGRRCRQRPTMHERAPSASARRDPPRCGCRRRTSPRSARPRHPRSAAAPRSSTARRRAGGRRDWRPPARRRRSCAAILASSTSRMPFSSSLRGQWLLIHSRSFQFRVGSNWLAVHWASERTPSMPFTWPARLPKVLRLPLRIESAQAGLVAMSMRFLSLISGGTLSPLRMSQWRWPSTCRSTVSMSALHPAAAARSISSRMKPRSRMT